MITDPWTQVAVMLALAGIAPALTAMILATVYWRRRALNAEALNAILKDPKMMEFVEGIRRSMVLAGRPNKPIPKWYPPCF